MKIIQQGDIELAKKYMSSIKTFECEICGCLWEADKNEYTSFGSAWDLTNTYVCKCPCCGNYVVIER